MDNPKAQAKYASNGKVMLVSTILLFLMIIIVVFLHMCRHSCFRRRRHRRHRRHAIQTDSLGEVLRPSVLKFLTTFTYSSATHGALHDCAVCLSEFGDGEECRALPNCNHAFHSHCIDAWFRSHSNCPLCLAPVHRQALPVQLPRTASSDAEPGPVSLSSFPAPVWCPRKPLELVAIIVESDSGHGHGFRISHV